MRRADEIAPRITLEQGKPVPEARFEILRAASIVEWDANEGRRAYGTIVPGEPGFNRYGLRLPIGPVAAFSPWNFPISSPGRKIGARSGPAARLSSRARKRLPLRSSHWLSACWRAAFPRMSSMWCLGNRR